MTTAIAPDPELIADLAYAATKEYPCFDASDRFKALLEYLLEKGQDRLDDNTQAAVIAACRRKAGLA